MCARRHSVHRADVEAIFQFPFSYPHNVAFSLPLGPIPIMVSLWLNCIRCNLGSSSQLCHDAPTVLHKTHAAEHHTS